MNVADHTPPYARYLVHLTRPFPNFDVWFVKPLRKKGVELLELKAGDRVLDVGCGMGGSFSYLLEAVGSSGEVVGVEISPDVLVNTKRRIATNKWNNVQLVEAPAQTAKLNGMFNGLIMFAAPDVYASREALENIFPHLEVNSRVVVFGAKTSGTRWGRGLNTFLRWFVARLSFRTTPKPDGAPLAILAEYVESIQVTEYFFGLMFLASGNFVRKRKT